MRIELKLQLMNELNQVYAVYYSGTKLAEGVGPEFQAVRKLLRDKVIDKKDDIEVMLFSKVANKWVVASKGIAEKLASWNVTMGSSGMGVNFRQLVGPNG